MQPTGVFISFEGIDGAGKSSHIQALSDAFRQQGREVVQTREPGGTALAEKLRDMVLHDAMDPLCEALLVFAARRDHLLQVIEPALAKGQVVLCDRFTDATFAYQGGGRGFDTRVLAQLESWVQARPDKSIRQPDITLWFSLDPPIAAQRLATARVPDRFESQPANLCGKPWFSVVIYRPTPYETSSALVAIAVAFVDAATRPRLLVARPVWIRPIRARLGVG